MPALSTEDRDRTCPAVHVASCNRRYASDESRIDPAIAMKSFLKILLILLVVLPVRVLGGGIYARSQVRGSLPQLDGTAAIPNLTARVKVERDALGVPTITSASREDVARALGFLHAQDRL